MKEYDVVGVKKNGNTEQITQRTLQSAMCSEHEIDNLFPKKSIIFDKLTTSNIKGIAIVMMIINHFFAFPEWQMKKNMYISIFMISGTPIELYIGQLCKLCVCIFAFISGYGLFISLNKISLSF